MIGYKAFNNDLACRDFQYEVGKIYKTKGKPMCCVRGFHFCKDLRECYLYYDFGSRICEVESLGDIDTEDNKKFCTNKIKIIRELSFEEICDIIGIKTIIGKNLIKSLELTKEFYRKRDIHLCGWWDISLNAELYYTCMNIDSWNWGKDIRAQLNEDFKKIKFFRWDDFNKVLFECDNEKIYQVEELEDEDLEWFRYLKNNLEF